MKLGLAIALPIPSGVVAAAGGPRVTMQSELAIQGIAGAGSYTWPALPLGTPAANRVMIVSFSWQGGAAHAVSSVTVGGTALTLVDKAGTEVNGASYIYYALVPTGTTGDVVVTITGAGATNMGGYLYSSNPLVSTPIASANINASTNPTVTLGPIAGSADGFVIYHSRDNQGAPNMANSNSVLTITFGTLRIGVNNTINYHYQGGYGDCDVGLTSGTFSCTTAATAAIRNLVTATWGTHGLTGFLLKEDGGKILQEDGTSGLLLET